MSNNNQASSGITMERRVIYPPRSISPEAQAFLSMAAQLPPWAPYPALADKAGWRKWAADLDQFMTRMMQAHDLSALVSSEAVPLDSARGFLATPHVGDTTPHAHGVCLEIHGGALIVGGGENCRFAGMVTALRTGARTYAVDYRMPPDHPYPAALDDCIAAYRALLKIHGAKDIVVSSLSAGGNLAAAMMLRLRDEGTALPAGLVLLSPELDLTESGDSFQVNAEVDVGLRYSVLPVSELYADGHALEHPYLSPLFGDFTRGFPPTLLQAGTRDRFLSNVARMHRALRKAGVDVELHLFEAMPHAGFFGAPEDRELDKEVRAFCERCWNAA